MIKCRNAQDKDMKAVAKTHIACFPDYFLTKLDGGNGKLLSKFYQSYLQNDAFFVVAEDEGEVVGFVMGYIIPNAASEKFEKENFWLLSGRFALLLLQFNKMAWERIFARLKAMLAKRPATTPECSDSTKASLLSICLKSEYRGSGVATQLIKEFEAICLTKGVNYYTLTALATNERGNSFYKKLGFEIKQQDGHSVCYFKRLGESSKS